MDDHIATTAGCSSTMFSVGGLTYSQVCGRIRGYQFGATSGFLNRHNQGIDGYYTEGLSLAHQAAGRRQHIWTVVTGLNEVTTRYLNEGCPCDTAPPSIVPAFVRVVYTPSGAISIIIVYSFPMMSSGMVRTVRPPAHAVLKRKEDS